MNNDQDQLPVAQESAAPALAKKPLTIRDWLQTDTLKNQIAQALPKNVCSIDRFMRVLFTSMQKTPKLLSCTQESLFSAFMSCGQLGIEPDGRRAHLIPYGTTCQLIIDYKGLVELALRSGLVSKIHADIVCEKDVFEYDLGEIRAHKVDWKSERGPMYAAYALVQMKDGATACAVMSKREIDGIRKRSRAGSSGPWVSDYDEMAKKTAFRRLSKWIPLSPELRTAIEVNDESEGSIDIKAEVIPPEIPIDPFASDEAKASVRKLEAQAEGSAAE